MNTILWTVAAVLGWLAFWQLDNGCRTGWECLRFAAGMFP